MKSAGEQGCGIGEAEFGGACHAFNDAWVLRGTQAAALFLLRDELWCCADSADDLVGDGAGEAGVVVGGDAVAE